MTTKHMPSINFKDCSIIQISSTSISTSGFVPNFWGFSKHLCSWVGRHILILSRFSLKEKCGPSSFGRCAHDFGAFKTMDRKSAGNKIVLLAAIFCSFLQFCCFFGAAVSIRWDMLSRVTRCCNFVSLWGFLEVLGAFLQAIESHSSRSYGAIFETGPNISFSMISSSISNFQVFDYVMKFGQLF